MRTTRRDTRALNAGSDDRPKDWRRPRGRPRQTWLPTVKQDVKQNSIRGRCGLPGTELTIAFPGPSCGNSNAPAGAGYTMMMMMLMAMMQEF